MAAEKSTETRNPDVVSTVDKAFFLNAIRDKGLSMRGLAKTMGLSSHSQLSNVFDGTRRLQLDEAAVLADALGVSIKEVMERTGARKAAPRRARLHGYLSGSGEVTTQTNDLIRVQVPEELPVGCVAIQARTADTALSWMDGWVFFGTQASEVEPGCVGRLSYVKVENGPAVVATVRRGYADGTYNLSGPYAAESVRLEWASAILMTKND